MLGKYFQKLPFDIKPEVCKSQNKIVMPRLLPKNERSSLFFYPEKYLFAKIMVFDNRKMSNFWATVILERKPNSLIQFV